MTPVRARLTRRFRHKKSASDVRVPLCVVEMVCLQTLRWASLRTQCHGAQQPRPGCSAVNDEE